MEKGLQVDENGMRARSYYVLVMEINSSHEMQQSKMGARFA